MELFSSANSGSGQIQVKELGNLLDWPKDMIHKDEMMLSAVSSLHSYDVYTVRIQLRELGISVEDFDKLKLTKEKAKS